MWLTCYILCLIVVHCRIYGSLNIEQNINFSLYPVYPSGRYPQAFLFLGRAYLHDCNYVTRAANIFSPPLPQKNAETLMGYKILTRVKLRRCWLKYFKEVIDHPLLATARQYSTTRHKLIYLLNIVDNRLFSEEVDIFTSPMPITLKSISHGALTIWDTQLNQGEIPMTWELISIQTILTTDFP